MKTLPRRASALSLGHDSRLTVHSVRAEDLSTSAKDTSTKDRHLNFIAASGQFGRAQAVSPSLLVSHSG